MARDKCMNSRILFPPILLLFIEQNTFFPAMYFTIGIKNWVMKTENLFQVLFACVAAASAVQLVTYPNGAKVPALPAYYGAPVAYAGGLVAYPNGAVAPAKTPEVVGKSNF